MNSRELARLIVKIAGLLIVVGALTELPRDLAGIMSRQTNFSVRDLLLIGTAPTAIVVGIGLLLFWCVDSIVDRAIFSSPAHAAAPTPDDFRAVEEVALVILGVYFICAGLSEGIYYLGRADLYYRYVAQAMVAMPSIGQIEFGGLLAAGLRLILGIGMIVFSRGLVSFRRWIMALRPMSNAD